MPKYTQLIGEEQPEFIYLPDGRTVTIRDLMGRRSNYKTVRIGLKPAASFAGRKDKYTRDEMEWIATSSMSEVQCRYGTESLLKAWTKIAYYRRILGLPKASRKTWPR
jgi:hypothetical protein